MRGWRQRRLLVPVVAVVGMAWLFAGCGGSGSSTDSSTGGSSSTDGGNSGGASSGGEPSSNGGGSSNGDGSSNGGGGSGGGGSGDGIDWVPFGPNDPKSPTPGWPVYNAFAAGDCPALRSVPDTDSVGDLGAAMKAVCAAAIEGQADQWEVAERSLAGGGSLANSCLDPLVRNLLERALAWHHNHPGKQPQARKRQVAGMTECGKASPPNGVPDTEDPSPTDPETPSDTGTHSEPAPPGGQSTTGSGG
jgi:hypothetical protein